MTFRTFSVTQTREIEVAAKTPEEAAVYASHFFDNPDAQDDAMRGQDTGNRDMPLLMKKIETTALAVDKTY